MFVHNIPLPIQTLDMFIGRFTASECRILLTQWIGETWEVT